MRDKKRDSAYYFETVECSCGASENLRRHKFNDEIRCAECVKTANEELVNEESKEMVAS